MAACSPQAFVHFPLSQVFRPHVSGVFDSRHFLTMVSSRRATASRTHKTWVWRCLTRSTQRLEAIAFDAVASTRTRGFTTFDMSPELSMQSWSTRRTPLHLSLSPPHFEWLPTLQGDAHQASRTKTKSTVGSSHTMPSRCLRRRPRLAVMFLVFGCCIRLASSFTANCSSHLSWL